jgi:hypothetical protein
MRNLQFISITLLGRQQQREKEKKGKGIEKMGSAEALCYLSLNGTLAENSNINISFSLAWL